MSLRIFWRAQEIRCWLALVERHIWQSTCHRPCWRNRQCSLEPRPDPWLWLGKCSWGIELLLWIAHETLLFDLRFKVLLWHFFNCRCHVNHHRRKQLTVIRSEFGEWFETTCVGIEVLRAASKTFEIVFGPSGLSSVLCLPVYQVPWPICKHRVNRDTRNGWDKGNCR